MTLSNAVSTSWDESLKIFTGNDDEMRSARVKMAYGELNGPVNVISNKSYQTLRKNFGNWKNLKVGTDSLYTPPLDFGRENLSNPRL